MTRVRGDRLQLLPHQRGPLLQRHGLIRGRARRRRAKPAPGKSVLTAFRTDLLDNLGRLSDGRAGQGIAAAARVISSSTDLQSKEREILAHHTKALAGVIADDVGGDRDVEARVVATALMGVHIALVELARMLALSGVAGDRLAEAVKKQGEHAFDRLEGGLRNFAPKPDGTGAVHAASALE